MRNCHIFNGGRGLTSLESCAIGSYIVPFIWNVALFYTFRFDQKVQWKWLKSGRPHLSRTNGSTLQMSFSPLERPYSLRSRPEKWEVFLKSAVYSIVNRFKCCIGLSHLQGDSNSINRNFNIYSLGGFPPIIYDDQRDVKGGHLFPLWMGLRGTKTSPASPLN